jgi:Susd and RagB outer membrane lipoprotein
MNRFHSYKNLPLLLLSLIGGLAGCTKNFEQYDTNPTALSNSQTIAILSTAIGPMEQAIYSNYQTAQNLSADTYAGYFMAPIYFNAGQNDANYFMVDNWNINGFKDQYNLVMAPVSKIAAAGTPTQAPDIWAVALLVQVEAMDRVTDRFGPIPYSKAGTSITSVAYDSQDSVYSLFFREIDTAAANLQAYIAANPGKKPLSSGDLIYGGDYTKWLKYANSLRLRLAMRIVKADTATAQAQAEKALSAPGGLLTIPGDDALFSQAGGRTNDLYTVTASYMNNCMGGALVCFMNGYNDPRLPVYATPAKDSLVPGKYIGIRQGIDVGSASTEYAGFSLPNCTTTFTITAPQYLMTAAEVWFLKAEAALRGWTGAGAAQTDYQTGIQTSFQQWNVSSTAYLTDNTSVEQPYVDPHNAGNNDATDVSTITIAWNPAATNEQNLERIITQKWIAMYPDGQEAWADYRRTGYPKLFPVVLNNSGGTISTQTQIRRLPYPSLELSTNGKASTSAIQTLLGGPDNGGTRLWWDVNKGNF